MKKVLKRVIQYFLMVLLSFIFLFPILWAFLSSFKTEQNVVAFPPQFFPSPAVFDNYTTVINRYPYMAWMMNSVKITLASTLLVLVISSLAAYAMARLEFRFKKVVYNNYSYDAYTNSRIYDTSV